MSLKRKRGIFIAAMIFALIAGRLVLELVLYDVSAFHTSAVATVSAKEQDWLSNHYIILEAIPFAPETEPALLRIKCTEEEFDRLEIGDHISCVYSVRGTLKHKEADGFRILTDEQWALEQDLRKTTQ